MELIVRVPGSCGEVMQGFWQGRPFLVTCPIDRYSTVVVRPGTKPDFPAFLRAARRHPAVAGVNVAHSGTVAGVFFCQSASQADREGVIASLSRQFSHWTYTETVHLRSGGISIENR